ncbi:hypothetical protein [Natrarchaeobaculum sulfurireducens]|nr:hypothetical protein [Natrarchaeobaculum sulfurireducens]
MPSGQYWGDDRDDDDECAHPDIIDRPGANPFCRVCGKINPTTD